VAFIVWIEMNSEPGWIPRWIRENGARLRDLRIERRISLKQLADEASVNVSQISRVEAGQDARMSTLLKIYRGLGYYVDMDLQESCEEVGDLLSKEAWRREEYRDMGLGQRWR